MLSTGISVFGFSTTLIVIVVDPTFLTYTVITLEITNIVVSNTSKGLITSVLFGRQQIAGTEEDGVLITEDATYYQEYADTSNTDVIILQEIEHKYYGLEITYNLREFNVNLKANI